MNYTNTESVEGRFVDKPAVAGTPRAPASFQLAPAWPNPFNPATNISYSIPVDSRVRLAVIDLLGNEVAVLVDGWRKTGEYDAVFDARDLSSGLYVYRLEAGHFIETRKMMLVR